MISGIDASNIRSGGGLTHLVELLRASDPREHGFERIIAWGSYMTLTQIEDRPWLVKSHQPILDRNLLYRATWQRFQLSRLAKKAGCNVLFVPGGSYAGIFSPVVILSQNLLPFEWNELLRYGWSTTTLKWLMLRHIQSHSLRKAQGAIFLTHYAQHAVLKVSGAPSGATRIIPHGIHARFFRRPREQRSMEDCTDREPFRILYVSIIDMYKHQWHVAEAVMQLVADGLSVALDLVGPAYPPALRRLRAALKRLDPLGTAIRYLGPIPHRDLPQYYRGADGCVFASSCENMPNILLEMMAAGLPVACSNRGPMPEILGDAGIYFDPENLESIKRAIRQLIESPALRARNAHAAFARSSCYSWEQCADSTFRFLADVAAGSS